MPERLRRVRHAAIAAAAALLAFSSPSQAQEQTSELLRIAGGSASSWVDAATGDRVLLVEGNVSVHTDDATLTADRAVLWISRPTADAPNHVVRVSLLGNATVTRGDVARTGGELFVTLNVRPDVELDVETLLPQDKSDDVNYMAATQLRRRAVAEDVALPTPPNLPRSPDAVTDASTRPVQTVRRSTVTFQSGRAQMSTTPDGKIALALSDDVLVLQTLANGDHVELQAQSAVIFTTLTDARAIIEGNRSFDAARDLDAVYLEGDVRMEVSPGGKGRAEQSLRASRLVYEFNTDRAILTDALLHTTDPAQPSPLVIRAAAMRKLGEDSYEADRASITTSRFATPAIALAATKVSVRPVDVGGGRTRTSFRADNVTPRLYGVPVFYLPRIWGTSTPGQSIPLRDVQISNASSFGTGVETEWGLFESLGLRPPENADASYRLDYFSERGPALGLDASYSGGYVSETSLQPWGFNGGFTGYVVQDDGEDKLGRRRRRIPQDDETRGRFRWDHQHFLTDGWQLQGRLGYVSDGTFLEEWFRNEFRNGLPSETALYLKRSQETEVFSVTLSLNTSNVATVADQLQEVVVDEDGRSPIIVERAPELAYHRLGDALLDDRLTFVSNNTASLLRFNKSYQSLEQTELGFRRASLSDGVDEGFAGIPSYGYTGYTSDFVARGDFRQEVAYPLGDDRVRLAPYGVVRYTAYSDSPDGDAEDRLLAGVGVRASTQFHRIYDGARSTLFDVHRVRHVIEPQMNLFASAQTTDRDELFVYDEGVDGISDIAVAQFVVKQRFQTKRGAPDRRRSVDFLTLNTGVMFFGNTPDEPTPPRATPELTDAEAFRGTFYSSEPEASQARSTLFADATWRVTDTTALLTDVAWNIEEQTLATTAMGLAVQRDPRVRYFAGVRYIGEVNSTIGTVAFDYKLTERYALSVNQSFDLNEGQNENTNLSLVRTFEQYVLTVGVFFDQSEGESGFRFSVSPRGLPFGFKVSDGNGGRR